LTGFRFARPKYELRNERTVMRHKSAVLRRTALGAILTLGVTLLPAMAAAATPTVADGSWSVTPAPGGYRVTLHLPDQLAARDALPELAVNGTSVGVAQESQDGRTLTVVTTDPAAAYPDSVQLAWNGQVADATSLTPALAHGVSPAHGRPTAPDPTAMGHYTVQRADYDFGDTALTLSGLGGRAVEERAAVWVPANAPGPRPVVIFLHGRHSACYNPTTLKTDNTNWPCVTGFVPIQSYHGYDQSAQVLASQGYVVVSISADGINAQDNLDSDDSGTLARGQLVIDHLNLLAQADEGHTQGMSPLLIHRLDLGDVGLMGHSRGGEGVVKAALLNAGLRHPYGIRAVLPLAPIDFGRETLPDVPMAVILPYCDGDVSNQQGQHFFDDTRYADPRDDVMRSSVLVMGADHNFFNTEWTPGVSVAPSSDDWGNENDATCGLNAPTTIRLTSAQQYQVGVSYIAGFFRLVMGHEKEFLPMFQSGTGSAVTVGAATVLQESQAPSSDRLDVAPLTQPASNVRFSGAVTGTYCASMAGRSPQSGLPSCTETTATSRFPSFTPANYGGNVTATPLLHLSWTGAGTMSADLSRHGANVSKYDALTVRATIDDVSTSADLTLTVVDGSGRSQSTKVSALGGAMNILPGTGTLLPKTWLESVRWPVSSMTHVDVRDIRRVLVSTATPTGGVFLSDLAFQSAGVGAGGPSELPRVSIAGTTVDIGTTPGTATVQLQLSRPTRVPVVAGVQVLAGSGVQIPSGAQQVVIPAGRTSVPVRITVAAEPTTPLAADAVYKVFVVDPTNAVVGQDFAHIVVHDDNEPAPSGT
jgi:dienelactone hydrolase